MRYLLSILIFIFSLFFSSAYANESAWSLLEEGGKIIFIRHAYAPVEAILIILLLKIALLNEI